MTAPKPVIPDAALTQHVAIVAQTGAGKSYATRVIVEGLLEERRRVCILDYTGVWYGLRSSASGKSSGYPVVIFGGDHADVPLNESAADVVARFVAQGEVPTVIDIDGMTVGAQQRFVTAFLEELYRLNSRPLHLVIEEIDEFAPQTGAKGTERLIGATARIFQRGRKKGFRAIAITQRPANTHKRVLAQCKTLIALRLTHPRDREAIEDWISGHVDDAKKAAEIVGALASLQTGEGFVWAPEQGVLERVKFPRIRTYDSMRAPEEGEAAEPAKWADVDLAGIRNQMGELVAQAEASDPAKLRAEISRLQKDRESAAAALAGAEQRAEEALEAARGAGAEQLVAAEVSGYQRALAERARIFESLMTEVRAHAQPLGDIAARIGTVLEAIDDAMRAADKQIDEASRNFTPSGPPAVSPLREAPEPPRSASPRAAKPSPGAGGDGTLAQGGLAKPLQRIVDAVAWWRAFGLQAPTLNQVAFIAGYKQGGTFDRYRSALISQGFIAYPQGGRIALTEKGSRTAAAPPRPPSVSELHARVTERLDAPLRKLFAPVLDVYPNTLSIEELAQRAGYSPGGTFDRYRSSLRSLELIAYPRPGEARAEDWLFPTRR